MKLERALFANCEPYEPEDGLWWLAFDKEGPCGFACLRPMKSDGYSFLARCGVLARARGQGLQKRFIAVREAKSKRLGINHLLTYVAFYNHPSANSLISAGYKLYKPQYKYGVRYALYFQKILA